MPENFNINTELIIKPLPNFIFTLLTVAIVIRILVVLMKTVEVYFSSKFRRTGFIKLFLQFFRGCYYKDNKYSDYWFGFILGVIELFGDNRAALIRWTFSISRTIILTLPSSAVFFVISFSFYFE